MHASVKKNRKIQFKIHCNIHYYYEPYGVLGMTNECNAFVLLFAGIILIIICIDVGMILLETYFNFRFKTLRSGTST